MRYLSLAPLVLIAACASTPPISPPNEPGAAPAARAAPRLADDGDVSAAFGRAGQADALTLDQVAALLGKPDLERRDGLGVFQTYRLEPCALLLAFAADARGVQRLRSATPGVRRAGDPLPDPQVCFAAAAARGRKAQS
jgi:hypothetical protein